MTFNESNIIEAYLCDLLARPIARNAVRDAAGGYRAGLYPPGRDAPAPLGWQPVAAADLPRQPQEVFVEPQVRAALIRLNPEIAARPERADEVLYKLRAIVLSVRSDGLVKCNEEFTAWLRGERSMPFGPNHAHSQGRFAHRTRTSAHPGRAQDHHHHHLQVRRGAGGAQ